MLYAVVLPGGYLTWLCTAMLLWTVAATGWALSLAGRSWATRLILPAMSVVTMVVACTGVTSKLLFPLQRAGLEQLATSPSGADHGLYHFSSIWSHDGCVTYVTRDSGMSSFAGLVRCTPGVQPSPRLGDTAHDAVFDPLGHDWYAFVIPRSGPQVWGFNPFTVKATTQV
jgi:hypothetical protein